MAFVIVIPDHLLEKYCVIYFDNILGSFDTLEDAITFQNTPPQKYLETRLYLPTPLHTSHLNGS